MTGTAVRASSTARTATRSARSAAPIDAKLGPLADYGGPTLTHALLSGSPAIDGGNPATPGSGGTACPTTDQRGETRPSGAACDVGSVEVAGGGAIAAFSVQPASGGTAGTVQLRVFGDGFVTGAVVRLVRAGFADVVGAATSVLGSVVTTDARSPRRRAGCLERGGGEPGCVGRDPHRRVHGRGRRRTGPLGRAPDPGRVPSAAGSSRSTCSSATAAPSMPTASRSRWRSGRSCGGSTSRFVVSPPPAQPGQIATDWSRSRSTTRNLRPRAPRAGRLVFASCCRSCPRARAVRSESA